MSPVDKVSRKEKESAEAEQDPRLDWEKENDEIENRKPDLEEIEGDTSIL